MSTPAKLTAAALQGIEPEELSPRLRALVDLIGAAAALKLVQARGGTRLYVPLTLSEGLLLVQLVGELAAAVLIEAHKGNSLEIDRGEKAILLFRNRQMRADYSQPDFERRKSAAMLAIEHNLSERHVWRILGGDDTVDTSQLNLYT